MNMKGTVEEMCTWEMIHQGSIIGCGRFKVKMKDGSIRTPPKVLHIPNLVINLISVGNMDVGGVKTMCGDGGCKIV